MEICGYKDCYEIDFDTFNLHIECGELESEVLSPFVTFYNNDMGDGVFEVITEEGIRWFTNVAG